MVAQSSLRSARSAYRPSSQSFEEYPLSFPPSASLGRAPPLSHGELSVTAQRNPRCPTWPFQRYSVTRAMATLNTGTAGSGSCASASPSSSSLDAPIDCSESSVGLAGGSVRLFRRTGDPKFWSPPACQGGDVFRSRRGYVGLTGRLFSRRMARGGMARNSPRRKKDNLATYVIRRILTRVNREHSLGSVLVRLLLGTVDACSPWWTPKTTARPAQRVPNQTRALFQNVWWPHARRWFAYLFPFPRARRHYA